MKRASWIALIVVCGAFSVVAQSSPAEAKSDAPEVSAVSTPAPVAVSTPAPVKETAVASGARAPEATLPPEKAAPVRLVRFEKRPTIDGRLEEGEWSKAAQLSNFYQVDPGDNSSPSQPTRLMLGYDDQYLYIAFHAVDEPGKVRATVPKRDNVSEDDNVRLLLDTFNDRRRAYIFIFNPLGVQQDGILTEGKGEDYSVDVVFDSKGALTSDGYVVEVAIPFKSLRYESGKNSVWGIHAFRRIKRYNNELDSWMPISRDNSGLLNQAGRITGIEGLSTERTLEIIPSLTLSETGTRLRTIPRGIARSTPELYDPGHFANAPIAFDPGLTAKLGITSKITLDLALNPDFAQVEADQLVVTANQRFPIFFPEKRPFFLEGIEIFRTPLTAVDTRAIVDPDAAVKLTGKSGKNTFGLLFASDNAPGNYTDEERADPTVLPGIARFLDKNAYIGILRLKRDVGKESSVGLLATTYNFIEKHNDTGGFDGRFRLDPQTVFDFQVLGSTSRRTFYNPDQNRNVYRTGNGFAYNYVYDHAGRNFGWQLSGVGRSRDYRADVGYTPRVDTNVEGLSLRYNSTPNQKARLVSWRVTNFNHLDFDWRGRSQAWESEVQATFNFQRQTYIGIGYERAYERVFEHEFGAKRSLTQRGAFIGSDPERSTNKNHYFFSVGTTPSKQYAFNLRTVYRQGHFDYDFGAGPKFPRVSPAALTNQRAPFDPGPGDLLEINASLVYQPTNALRTSLDYTKNRLVRRDTDRLAFDDNIYSLRATYQFTRFTFARARIDYTTLSSRARGQFLLGWAPNPGTSFYVGYNDDLNRNSYNPFTSQLEPGFQRNSRTFFIKMSYLFRRNL
jgi:hypothetical protein